MGHENVTSIYMLTFIFLIILINFSSFSNKSFHIFRNWLNSGFIFLLFLLISTTAFILSINNCLGTPLKNLNVVIKHLSTSSFVFVLLYTKSCNPEYLKVAGNTINSNTSPYLLSFLYLLSNQIAIVLLVLFHILDELFDFYYEIKCYFFNFFINI